MALTAAPLKAFDQIQFLDETPLPDSERPISAAAFRDRLYVVDEKKNALFILDAEGAAVKTVSGKELFSSPGDVAVSRSGEIFVADTGNDCIRVLDADGEFLRTIGSKGSEPGFLNSPQSVAVGEDGRVYVADTGNNRVQVYTREGIFLLGFGPDRQAPFSAPARIAVDFADCIYLLDKSRSRIMKFNPQARFEKEFAAQGEDFAVDEYGAVYVIDKGKSKVKQLDAKGSTLGVFGAVGKGQGRFRKPEGIALAPDRTVLVADTGNKRISRAHLITQQNSPRLEPNLETKLLISGPTRTLRLKAAALGSLGRVLYAYLPMPGQFVAIGPNGNEILRFGRKTGKDESATKGARGFALSEKFGMYAADTDGHKIQNFTAKGIFKSSFGGASGFLSSRTREGSLKSPCGVAINERGTIYVADEGNRRVDAFSPEGTFISSLGPKLGSLELRRPVAVAWDEKGAIFVLDRALKKVVKCDVSGNYLTSWGGEGEGTGQFDDPLALAYDGRSYVYVLDRGLRRVSVFNREGRWITNFFSRGMDERGLDKPEAMIVAGSSLVVSDPKLGTVAAFDLHPQLGPPAAVSTRTIEGDVYLKWDPVPNPWVKRYRILRSTDSLGAYAEAGQVEKPAFKDARLEASRTFFYRIAVEAQTGDVGPPSRPVEVYVAGALNRALVEISSAALGNIFSSNYKWYKDHPLGKVVVSNNSDLPFKDVKLSFRLKDYMDFATERIIERLGGREKAEIELTATLNNRILEVTEDTPVQAEITLTFFEKGRQQEVSRALPLKVYSRNAITWEDPSRLANYVTPKDPPVLDLVREILRSPPPGAKGSDSLNDSLLTAMRLWAGLGSIGVKFLPSPNNPFEQMSQDPLYPVDYTQFPRETLKRKSGQCDDLTSLLASMLEGATLRTVYLDYPGHIALMFDTGSNDPLEIGLPGNRLVEHAGAYWIPLETTMIGSPFTDAARKALSDYRQLSEQGKARIIDLRKAWQTYEPATLPPAQQESPEPRAAAYVKELNSAAAEYAKARYEFLLGSFKKTLAKKPQDLDALNNLGILYAQYDKVEDAVRLFEQALEVSSDDPTALNNLGTLAYGKEDYEKALNYYVKAAQQDAKDPELWMNLARTTLKLGQKDKALKCARKATTLDKSLKPAVEALFKQADGGP